MADSPPRATTERTLFDLLRQVVPRLADGGGHNARTVGDLELDSLERLEVDVIIGGYDLIPPDGDPGKVLLSVRISSHDLPPLMSPIVLVPSPEQPAIIASQNIRLEAVRAEHMPWLYGLALDGQVGFRWRYRGTTPPMHVFENEFWQGVLAQLVAVDRGTGDLIGLVVAYNPDLSNGHVYVGAVAKAGLMRSGRPAEAVGVFFAYLFKTWPFRKVYLEVPEFNVPAFRSAIGRDLQLEGCLKNYEYYDGRYWDRYILSLTRSASIESSTRELPLQ